MASLGIFDGRTVSSGNLPVGVVSSFPQIHWESDEFIRDMHIWTSDGSPKSLRNIALLLPYADDLRGQLPVSAFNEPPFWIQSPGPQTRRTESPGDRLAGLISTSPPSKQNQVILDAVQFAIRLAVEGSIDACNEIIGCLLRVFPGAPELLLDRFNVRRPLEFLWDATSQRPAFVPWQAPSAAELDGWDAAKRDGHKLPPREEYEKVLESVALRIRYGDAYLRPYTLAGAVAMAADSGDDTHALQWMDMLVHQEYRDEDIEFQHALAEWRALSPFFVSGFVGRTVGRAPEQVEADAKIVVDALNSFRETSEDIARQKQITKDSISKISWKELVLMLETLKWEEHEVLRRLPAASGSISEVEHHLGVALPGDYAGFLLASNGVEFMPSVSAPGFRHVDELAWQTGEELGLDGYRIDLGCAVTGATQDRLPKMDRVLMISEDDSEEMVWYIHPHDVERAIEILKDNGKTQEEFGEPGWRAIYWAPWMSDLKWLKSFRAYMESLAYKAHKAGAQLESDGTKPKSLKLII
ncbi:hypothetical protein PUNSTDRAFT_111799 [Punctularia strigosozonata HHB-11173 SS5]|uniref:uncharacterized protein n=1 Tax=Punctularia strigosozonata (strain HHB-11173) TaxID=741275 RepID=UPI0004417718|nr:uncharacterized protein PUNSTDRAFT_111799 [Punctularia strigosozonata HHB-11173 SS5]EIN11753.1 hypothetical protein PUNSTDRAFT_111799 [Punctularia strigosozonata HHB-11173 SS5]